MADAYVQKSLKICLSVFLQENFIQRQLINLPYMGVNIRNSNFVFLSSFCVLAPTLENIDNSIRKDVLVMLGKVAPTRPPRLADADRFKISLGYRLILFMCIFSLLEWEVCRYGARTIQGLLMDHPRCRQITGICLCLVLYSL